jgi:hypothetical protein
VASGLFNTARQAGTSVGLAVLGYAGARATLSQWHTRTARISHSTAVQASTQVSAQIQHVVTGRVAAVGHALGPAYRQAAVASFEHGYHWAVGLGAVFLAVAATVARRTFPVSAGTRAPTRAQATTEGGRHEQR